MAQLGARAAGFTQKRARSWPSPSADLPGRPRTSRRGRLARRRRGLGLPDCSPAAPARGGRHGDRCDPPDPGEFFFVRG